MTTSVLGQCSDISVLLIQTCKRITVGIPDERVCPPS